MGLECSLPLEREIKLSDKEGYYGSPFRYWLNQHLEKYIEHYCPKEDASILDLGCGLGIYYKFFRNIQGKYLGVDLTRSEHWVSQTYNSLKVCYKVLDASRLASLNHKFNFIMALTLLEHVPDDSKVLEQAGKLIEEGNFMVVAVPSKYSRLLDIAHGYRCYSSKDFPKLSQKSNLDLVELTRINGAISFFFHFCWFASTRLLAMIIKAPVCLLFFNRRERAREVFPNFMYYLDNLMYLYLKTSLGRFVHRNLNKVCARLDKFFPFLESGYLGVFKKSNDG